MAYSKVPLKVTGAFDNRRAWSGNLQESLNMFLEPDGQSGKGQFYMLPTPGTEVIGKVGADVNGTVLGSYTDSTNSYDSVYVAKVESGSVVAYRLNFTSNKDYTVTNLGTCTNFSGDYPVQILGDDTFIVFFEAGIGRMYTWNKDTSNFSANVDSDYGPNQTPQVRYETITYLDNYYICNERGSDRFWVSDLTTPLSWTATSFARAEGQSDPIVRVFSVRNELWLFGKNTIEIWTNSGNIDFPFEPIPNAVFEFGLAAAFSVTHIGGQILMLSKEKSGYSRVMSFDGFNPSVISNTGIEYIINNNFNEAGAEPQVLINGFNVIGMSYIHSGHSFYILNFPSSLSNLVIDEELYPGSTLDSTEYSSGAPGLETYGGGRGFVVDMLTKTWHTRRCFDKELYDLGQKQFTAWTYDNITFANNTHIIFPSSEYRGDLNQVCILRYGIYQDFYEEGVYDGIPIPRIVNTPYFVDKRSRIFWLSLELDIEHPLISTTELREYPQVTLYYSNNLGASWVNAGTNLVSGLELNRIRWRRLGKSRDRLYSIYTDSNSKFVILGIYAEIDKEDEQ